LSDAVESYGNIAAMDMMQRSQDGQQAPGAASFGKLDLGAEQNPEDAFQAATQGQASPLPYRGELEKSFGEDFTTVEAFLGKADALHGIGAEAATLGEKVAFGEDYPSKEVVSHELTHVVQDRKSGAQRLAAKSALGRSGGAAEVEADTLGARAAAGQSVAGQVRAAPGGELQRLEFKGSGEKLSDASAAQADLDATPQQKAADLYQAIRDGNMREVYQCLGGNPEPVRQAFRQLQGLSVQQMMRIWLPSEKLTYGLAFARFGRADLKCRVQAVTIDILGTDEERLFSILEKASIEERYALANDQQVLGWLTGELSGGDLQRALAPLRPLMGTGGISEQAKKALFEKIEAEEASASMAVQGLLVKLRARKGFWNDDEAGMIKDVKAFASARGPMPLDDVNLAPALAFLNDELSDREYEQACNIIRTGNKPSLMDKIGEAGQEKTLFISNVDEKGIYEAIAKASPEERQAILASPEDMAQLSALLDEGELARATELLSAQQTGQAAAGMNELLDELDSWLWVSDSKIFACLEKMETSDLVRLRQDDELRQRVEDGLSEANIVRFHEVIGYSGSQAAGAHRSEAEAAQELAQDDARLVARIEEATGHWDDDEDKVYRAVLDWQKAGGQLDLDADRALLDRAFDAMADLGHDRRFEVYEALIGLRSLTQLDRAESAAIGLGTDDTGLEAALKAVTPEELVLEWSNLDQYRALAEAASSEAEVQALADFVPDISDEVKEMIAGERDDWLELLEDLRDKLVKALEDSRIAAMAEQRYHFVVRQRQLARLKYAQASAFSEHDRGAGFWNAISMGVMDSHSATGELTDMAFGAAQGDAAAVMVTEEGSEEEQEALKAAGISHQEYIQSHNDYTQAKKAAASIGGAIVATIVSTLVTIATAGTAGPACVTLVASLAGAAFKEVTELAIQGNDYSVEQGAEDLSVALINGVLTLGLGQVAEKLTGAMGNLGPVKAIYDRIATKFPGLADYVASESKELLKSAVTQFPRNYATDLVKTEGLLRQGLSAASVDLEKALKTHAKGIFIRAVHKAASAKLGDGGAKAEQLANEGQWQGLATQNLKQGIVDMAIKTAADRVYRGEPLGPADLIALLGGVVKQANGARLGTKAAKQDSEKTLKFFNEASLTQLRKVEGLGRTMSKKLVEQREAQGGFSNLRQVAEVPRFKMEVLKPAAVEVRDHWTEVQESSAASAKK